MKKTALRVIHLILIFGLVNLPSGWALEQPSVVNLVHQSREKIAEHDLGAALSLAREAVKLDPAYADAWKQLGRVLMLRQEYPEALTSLETAIELRPDDQEVPTWIISLLMELDRSQAAQLAARWETKATHTGVRLAAPALGLMIKGDLAGAEKALKAAPRPETAKSVLALAWTYLGNLFLKQHQTARAIDAFQEALQLLPHLTPALRELGWAYRRSGKPAQAADTWERGLEKNPQLVTWIAWIAEARSAARQPITASPAIQRLLESEPSQDQGRIMKLALLLLEKDRTRGEAYEQQLAQRPNGQRLTTLAHGYADRLAGRYADAALKLEDLKRSNPNDPEVRRLLADTYTQWAAALPPRDQIGPLRKLVSLEPERASAWRDLGWSLWLNKQSEAAIEAWSRAIQSDRSQRQSLIMQVVALLAEAGEAAQAMELYRKWQPGGSLAILAVQLVKAGRTLAAEPFLEAAWKAGENPPLTGLYLAAAKTQKGICVGLPQYLAPFMARGIEPASQEEGEVLLKVLKACSDDPEILPLLKKVEVQLAARPGFAKPVGDLLEQAASERLSLGYTEEALKLYRRLLERDPDRPRLWFQAADLAQTLGEEGTARVILSSTLVRAKSAAVKEGIRGKLAQDQGNFAAAVPLYRQSLAHDPMQPEVRMALFDCLVALKRFDEARREGGWFSRRVAQGEYRDKIYLAQVRNALGEPGPALKLWREINLTNPDNPYYAVETARTLLNLCRAQEALEVLEPVAGRFPNVRVFELLGEINGALDRPRQVLEWTEQGLALKKTRRLLEMRVEAADNLEESEIVLEGGEALLNMDRGYVPAARAVGRALQALGRTGEAKKYYEDLLKRNPEFLPSQVALKDISSGQGHPKKAVDYAKETVAQRPWDTDASRRLAVAQAEAQQFVPALKTLRYLASQSVNKILTLIYTEVNPCAYPGRNSSRQVVTHLERLAAEGYQFTVPPDLDNPQDRPQVMVVIVDAEAPALREVDEALRRLGGRAVCAVNPAVMLGQVPDLTTTKLLRELQTSGRWLLASSGPEDRQPIPVGPPGTLGNPLTHRLSTPKGEESDAAMANRLRQTLGESARSLPAVSCRTLVYPKGDYGQYSLDTDREALATLKSAVKGSFGAAVAGDDQGFITPGYDSARLPGRTVPPTWDDDKLMRHLKEKNPYISSRLDLGKVLFWQGQHEEGNRWFRQAAALGADPAEVSFNWGANAYYEGDLPTALEKLRRARELDPTSEKYASMLEKAELAKRPLLEGTFSGWNDSDSRSRLTYGGSLKGYVNDRLQLEVFGNRNRWARSGIGSEDGTRLGGGLLWHFLEECWFRGRLWIMDLDNLKDHAGWFANVHFPNPYLSGNVEIFTERDQEDTVEAVRRGILAYRQGIQTSTRVFDTWDVLGNFYFINRTDGNNTPWGELWIIKRLHEKPFYGVGALLQLADSTKDVPEYWSPQSMQKYMLYATTRGDIGPLNYSLSVRVGPAKESGTDWRIVWGGRAALDLRLTPRFSLSAIYDRLETPTYHKNLFWSGVFIRF